MKGILLYFLLCCLMVSSCDHKTRLGQNYGKGNAENTYKKFEISEFDSINTSLKYIDSWKNSDTFYYETIIDSLSTFNPKDCISICYFLSEETGFGYTFVDINDFTWYDTLSIAEQKRVVEMMIGGFKIYKNSNLFMKKLPHPISIHEYLKYNFECNEERRKDFFVKLLSFCNEVAKCYQNMPIDVELDPSWKPKFECD